LEIEMKTPNGKMATSVLAAAVQGALLAMCVLPAHAEDETVAALTTPDNFVEVGVASVDKQSAKFGEYSGLNKSDPSLIGNFSVRGGDYGSENGTTRWSANGSNLGLTSRELGASFSNQGTWNIGVNYDELRHNTTDGYQTPYVGDVGGNNFTLPAGFGTTANTVTALTAAQRAALHTVDVNNTRKNTSLTAGYNINKQLRLTFDFNNLEQSGAKLMAFSSDGNLGGGVSAERIAILPNPTNYTTDTFNLAMDWAGEKGHLTAGYYGSFFRDHYDRVNWTTFAGANAMDTMSTAPSNQLHQLNLSGGYRFSPQTKLTGGLSYGRNTQDSGYVASAADLISIPQTSLNGNVITTHADAKLVNQTTRDLKLSAGVTYNKRDNRTQSNIYSFRDIGAGTYDLPNTPFSHDKTQLELAGDYRLGKSNKIRLAYSHDDTKRRCNSYGVDVAYPAGTNCLVDTATTEDKLSLGYKLKMMQAVDLSVGYVYGERTTDYNTSARVALDSVRGGTVLDPYTAGTIAGLNGGDYVGFHPIFDASRKQQMLKIGANWQASDALAFGIGSRYTDDSYTDATFGAQSGTSWNLNLDATFNYSENGSVFAYISQDYRDRDVKHVNRSNTTTNAYIWSDQLKDQSISYGLGFKQGGLMSGKLDLKADLTYSDAKSNYSSALLYTFTGGTTTSTSCALATAMTCGTAPDIANKLTQVKLTGTYKVDKQSKVALGYIYQKLSSTDYYYDAYQYLYTATSAMPSNQQSGSHKVNVVAASYTYNFK
jgi:MtrB/PioB family decaheme-associated outer membrane protein